ncbi:MAG: polyphosphate kinase 1 [Candidatus Sericytochromatia bacterium]|nr:polyphosphate kinase 1 [Candidatus Sericytochromatia bacterium]
MPRQPRRGVRTPYLNAEISWLDFNGRVLEEAADATLPALERLRFLAISATNLDEFFMIRVAGLQQQLASGRHVLSPDGLAPSAQLEVIRDRVLEMTRRQEAILTRELLPSMAGHGIRVLRHQDLPVPERERLARWYHEEVFPVLTPLAVDTSHPFPIISNLSLNLGMLVDAPHGGEAFARVKLPPNLPRFVPLQGGLGFLPLEELVAAHVDALFPEIRVRAIHPFRVTRHADIEIAEDEAVDLLTVVEQEVRKRRFGRATRLEVTDRMPAGMRDMLVRALSLSEMDVYATDTLTGLGDLMQLARLPVPDLQIPAHLPSVPKAFRREEDLFAVIRERDVLVHHPFEAFDPVVDFIWQAAEDPNVLAIKQTLYRTTGDSGFIEALGEAAERGKQVAVVVELKARFDEENNILWAKRLEQRGVHVTYGLVGLKTHGKLALVVRREPDGIRRYVHMATGNYNPSTARGYTDLGLFTADPDVGADASDLFNTLTGYSRKQAYRRLLVAPEGMRSRLVALIREEAARKEQGRIVFKCNALTDIPIIRELYAAAQAGVAIDLVIRGMCCLRPGVPGLSERIRVRSVVGRFLEHSRVFAFGHGDEARIWIGSADMMARNLDHRVEVLFPVRDPAAARRIREEVLASYLADDVKARILDADGNWSRPARASGASPVDAQAYLMEASRPPAKSPRVRQVGGKGKRRKPGKQVSRKPRL